ncbi:NAD-dependent epimerase/dehydratase family protein [Niallia circulans]|jgi:nucleoside-diphosphate-sugar epimerase|uniref:NAD-dependent epimerase/dehydratase family protein n=1 Tax=Niallia circulans TaxID=1397 RepID=UPI001F4781CC|nr:NAD-dependent epimerase/dehydratase family protein [Niallia circulans]MCF2649030.1 NAD-dependent epimerase/dehydratase family protein [Niallia circulans]
MKKILVLGGTRFFGKKLVEMLLEEGHQVTIMTRGTTSHSFGDQVEHIIGDRSMKEQLINHFDCRKFDIVYDNICYTSNEARDFCEIFNGNIGKLVFTSSLSTYAADGMEKREEDFDPYHYPIAWGDKEAFTYNEGKRQAEAVFFQYATFPVVAVRFPIVLGEDDYTGRLHFHVERIQQGKTIGFVNMDAEMSFILATEAAMFLKWAGFSDVEGPFNATANGKISMGELIRMIEKVTGHAAKITLKGDEENTSPFAIPATWYMNTEKAGKAGFVFTNLDDWLPALIEKIAGKDKH